MRAQEKAEQDAVGRVFALMAVLSSPALWPPELRVRYVEEALAEARRDPAFVRFRESVRRARRITQADLDFRVGGP